MIGLALCSNTTSLILLSVLLLVVFMYHLYIRNQRSQRLSAVKTNSDTRYHKLADLLPQMVFEVDSTGKFSFINSSGQEITAFTRIDIDQGLNIFDILHPEDLYTFKEEFYYIREGGRNKGQEFRILTKNGRLIPMTFYMNQMLEGKKNVGVRGIIIDISERKRLEQQLLTAIIETEDRERKRFSEDLHDGLGPLLSTIKLYVNQMNIAELTQEERDEMMRFTNELLDESISNTKSIANNILPGIISDNGLVPALNSFFSRIQAVGKMEIHFEHDIPYRLPTSVENSLYRIVNELLNNTIKHAQATKVIVQLNTHKENLVLSYEDDGIGYDSNSITRGLGLENIQSRARSINASASITTSLNHGFLYELKMQLEQIR